MLYAQTYTSNALRHAIMLICDTKQKLQICSVNTYGLSVWLKIVSYKDLKKGAMFILPEGFDNIFTWVFSFTNSPAADYPTLDLKWGKGNPGITYCFWWVTSVHWNPQQNQQKKRQETEYAVQDIQSGCWFRSDTVTRRLSRGIRDWK